jgi:hypothetical protein
MRSLDASSMQSVRHTPGCIDMASGVSDMELRLPGRLLVGHCSPWASPHHVSASVRSPWANSGNGKTTRSGIFGEPVRCLTGQIMSVRDVLAGLHIHTGRLDWGDFGFEFWEYWRDGTSARVWSKWCQLCYGEPQAWMLLVDITCARPWPPCSCGQGRYGLLGL